MPVIKWVPMDFTALQPAQQTNMFKAWCKLVMAALPNYSAGGVLKFEEMGESGMAVERVIQGAQVWISLRGKKFKTNLLVAFNDMLEQDFPRQGSDVRRNDPNWFAGSLVERAKDWELWPPSEGYGVLPWPTAWDLEA